MSENIYSTPAISGEFRLIDIGFSDQCGKCFASPFDSLCLTAIKHCGTDNCLELIPGTDAPAVDPRDAEIAELRAKLAALESAKPLAVLPPLTGSDLKGVAEHARRNWMANHVHENGWHPDYVHALIDSAYALAHSRIQPVSPDLLAALASDAWAASESAAMACQRGDDFQTADEWFRARLAAGKGVAL